jgi:hypothetical protein
MRKDAAPVLDLNAAKRFWEFGNKIFSVGSNDSELVRYLR